MYEDKFDQKFINISGKVVNCILLSILWVIFSIPVFTIGASTTALLKSCGNTILKEEGYAWKTFWESFKSGFKRTTFIWLVLLTMEAALFLDLRLILALAEQNGRWHVLTVFCLMIMLFAAVIGIYSFMQELRLNLALKEVLKNAVVLAFCSIGRTILILMVCAVSVAGCAILPFLAIVLPGIAAILYYKVADGAIQKYLM